MTAREFVFDNLTGDLEFHPKRAVIYLALGAAGLCTWFFTPWTNHYSTAPLTCAFGSAVFLLKAIFLLRKSSDGLAPNQALLGLSPTEVERPIAVKTLPSPGALIAQMIQDFGTGDLLGAFALHAFNSVDETRTIPTARIVAIGAILFAVGWLIRHLSSPSPKPLLKAIRDDISSRQ